MDNNVDPRIFMNNCDMQDPVVCMRSSINMEPGVSFRNSQMDPRISRNISYNAQISRSSADNNECGRQSIRESKILEQEMKPLTRRANARFKPINPTKHSCTDVHCLLIFVAFIVAWVYIASYALTEGDLNKVLIPSDSNNAKCGLDSGVRDKKMLFFFNLDKCLDPLVPLKGCNTKQICVNSCPKTSFAWEENKKTDFNDLKAKLICDSNIDKETLNSLSEIEKAMKDNHCSDYYLRSDPFFNRCLWDFCDMLPQVLSRRSRSLEINTLQAVCAKRSENSTNIIMKEKVQESNFNRLITAIISKFNYTGKDILAEHIISDLKNSWKTIILAFIIHLCAVLLFITLLRWFAAPLLWISICGVILSLSIFFVYSFKKYQFWSNEPHVPQHGTDVLAVAQNVFQDGKVWCYITIVVGALLTIILLVVFVIRKRIKIAVAIIKEASKAITNIKSSIFFPIFPGILYIIVAVLSAIIMLYLSSIGDFSFIMVRRTYNGGSQVSAEKCVCAEPLSYKLGDACIPEQFEKNCHLENDITKPCVETSCSFKEIVKKPKTQWFMLFNVFGFLWVTFFISAYEDMVLACTFSIWYWTFEKKDIPKLPLLKAVWLTTFYHLGTLAFGSLILSICRMIRYTLELIEKKTKLYDNALTRAILCCMKCFFWILENFLRFLNRNAYITCAIHSTSFCNSSRKAFSLITQNIMRVYVIDKVSDFLFFLSKLLVSGCTSFLTYLFLETYPTVIPVYYPVVPVALVAILAYIMAHFIFSTYSMAVDTLFFCFLEDSSENDGSAERPFYMSKELNKLLGKSKIKRKQIKK